MESKTTACFAFLVLAGVVFLAGSGVEAKLPDVMGTCTFMEYFCSARMCFTTFFKGLQKNPNNCSGTFLTMRSCLKNARQLCLGATLDDNQTDSIVKPVLKEEEFCFDDPQEIPTAAPGPVLHCGNNFQTEAEKCQRELNQKYSANKADPALCSTYASGKKCLKDVLKYECNFPSSSNEELDLSLGVYNPFCANNRDPGATGTDQCSGVAVPTTATVTATSDSLPLPPV